VVLDCVYPLARDHLSFPELLPDHEPHAVREVHLMRWDRPQFAVDIAETMELKLAAIACHASQVRDRQAMERGVRERAAVLGSAHGLACAEGFDRLVLAR
jgi:LmbE family N-acetylglucosaminyl deacetylase